MRRDGRPSGLWVSRPLVVGGGVLLMAGMLVLVAPLVLIGLALAAMSHGEDPSDGGRSSSTCEFVEDADELVLAELHAEALAALFPKVDRPTARSSCSGLEGSEQYDLTVVLREEQPSYESLDAALEPLGWRRREGDESVPRLAVFFDREPAGALEAVLRIDAEHEGLFVAVRLDEG